MNGFLIAIAGLWFVANGPTVDQSLAQSIVASASRAEQSSLAKPSPDVFNDVLASTRALITSSGDSPATVQASLEYVLSVCHVGGGKISGASCPQTDAAYEALTNLLALARALAGEKPAAGLGGDQGSAPFGPPASVNGSGGPDYHGPI